MKKKTAKILLGVLSVVFAIVIGSTSLFLAMAWLSADDWSVGTAVIAVSFFALLHAFGSSLAAKRYKRKYELPAPKFVLINILPMLALAVLIFYFSFFFGDLMWALLLFAAIFLGVYAIGYAVMLTAVMGISYAVSRKRRAEWEKTTR